MIKMEFQNIRLFHNIHISEEKLKLFSFCQMHSKELGVVKLYFLFKKIFPNGIVVYRYSSERGRFRDFRLSHVLLTLWWDANFVHLLRTGNAQIVKCHNWMVGGSHTPDNCRWFPRIRVSYMITRRSPCYFSFEGLWKWFLCFLYQQLHFPLFLHVFTNFKTLQLHWSWFTFSENSFLERTASVYLFLCAESHI